MRSSNELPVLSGQRSLGFSDGTSLLTPQSPRVAHRLIQGLGNKIGGRGRSRSLTFRPFRLQKDRLRAVFLLRVALNETRRCKTPDHPGMGPMGANAIHRSGWGNWPRFAKVLCRATRHATCPPGFSNTRSGQVGNGLRLAARRAAPRGEQRSGISSAIP